MSLYGTHHKISVDSTVFYIGTGKTTTLVQFAKRNRHLSIGYCVYNR